MNRADAHSACASAPTAGRPSAGRRVSFQTVRAMTKEQVPSSRRGRTYERILRYPGGDVRRIRYPLVESDDGGLGDLDVGSSTAGHERELSWDVPGLWGGGHGRGAAPPKPAETGGERAKRSNLPASPAELLRYLQSEEYRNAERELQRRVRESYQVLEGCPWVFPRPLFIIATRKSSKDDLMTYTLRTRVDRNKSAAELSKLLRGKDADGFLRIGAMLDGIVAFQNQDDAQRFRDSLEAEGWQEVTVAAVDSHDLFRNSQQVKAVVVCMTGGDYLPFPSELATSLRGQQSFDDGWGT